MYSAIKTLARRKLLADHALDKQALVREWVDSKFNKFTDFLAAELSTLIACGKVVVPQNFDAYDVYLLADEIANDFGVTD